MLLANQKNYFRFLRRNSFYTIINILGLSPAIALSLLLFLFCFHELSYDKFHLKADDVYLMRMDYISNGEVIFNMYPPTTVYDLLKNDFSYVKSASRIYVEKDITVQSKTGVYTEGNLLKVDRDFFKLFNFTVENGKQNSIFENNKSIFISNRIAEKYFNDEYPVGKAINLSNKGEYLIAGIVDAPSNSSIQFDFIISTLPTDVITWQFGVVAPVYFESETPSEAENILIKMQAEVDSHYGKGSFRLGLIPLSEQYFNSNVDFTLHGNKRYVSIFAALGVIVLLLSAINYVNLATAQSIKRSKEIGIRKVIGAQRKQLVQQYLIESAILVAVSMILSFLFIFLFMDSFKSLVGKEISIASFHIFQFAGFLILFFAVLTGLSGLYPALWTSRLQPVHAISNHAKGIKHSGQWLRKGMVIFQFSISTVFIILTLVMRSQMDFLLNQKLGFDKDQVLRLKITQAENSQHEAFKNYQAIKKELLEIKSVSGVTVCPMPDFDASFEGIYKDHGEEKSTNAFVYKIDEDFLKVMGAHLIAGRNLNAGEEEGVLINQTAAKLFFDGDPLGMQNKMLSKKKVIGIVNDFHFNGMKSAVQPLVLEHFTKSFKSIQIKIQPGNIRETLANVKKTWTKYAPDEVFEFSFLNEDYNRLYRSETRTSKIFSIFCLASVIIACLGLIGMASHALKDLQKDLSIRKIFGASINDNLILVLGSFLKPVSLSIAIAVPFAVWFSTLYLREFVYRIELSIYLVATGIVLIIVFVLFSIGFQALKAANTNPLSQLKEP